VRVIIPFVGPQIEGRSGIANDQRCVNLYPKLEGPNAKTVIGLYRTPGLKYHVSAGTGPCRSNGAVFQDRAYFVSGKELVWIDYSGLTGSAGTLDTIQGRVSIARGWDHLLLTDGTNGYTYDGVTFAKITDPDFPQCDVVCWSGHYYLAVKKGTNQFYVSALNDPTNWYALGFASAEAQPDKAIAAWPFQGYIILFGDETIQLYRQTGNVDFPFDPVTGLVIEHGLHAIHSLAEVDDILFFLGKSRGGGPLAMMAQGQTPVPISTPDIEWRWNKFINTKDATGYAYRHVGHIFYVITFPAAKETYVYDVTTQMWHERSSYGVGYHRAGGHVFFNSKHILGDTENEKFYTYDFDTYKDGGDPLVWIRRAPVITDPPGNRRIFFDRLELDFSAGLGLTSGQGSDPQCMLRWSNDGWNWSAELWRGMGKIGEFRRRAVWNRLGSARYRIFEVSGSDPMDVIMFGATLEARIGES